MHISRESDQGRFGVGLRGRRAVGFAAGALACVLVAATAQSQAPLPGADPVPICQLVPNGSFDDGFTGWTPQKAPGGYGEYTASQSATIEDHSAFECGDEAVACLSVFAAAEWVCEHPSGSGGQAQTMLNRKVQVTGRYLRFEVSGGFGAIVFDDGEVRYVGQVVVTDDDGNTAKCEIINGELGDADWGCNVGVAIDGLIACEKICCDIVGSESDPTGIEIGETVNISFVWSTAVNADHECDYADFGGLLCIDDVQFCNGCLTPAPLPIEAITTLEPVTP